MGIDAKPGLLLRHKKLSIDFPQCEIYFFLKKKKKSFQWGEVR